MAVNLTPRTRQKWRDLGYFVEGTESISQIPGGLVRRNDLFGCIDAVALKLDDPTEPWVFLQITGWGNVSQRYRKIQRESTGKGQWAVPMADIVRAVINSGHRVIIEGWRKGKNGRYECREKELTLADLEPDA